MSDATSPRKIIHRSSGTRHGPRTTLGAELAVFAPATRQLRIEAEVATEFVLGSATPHPHPLVLGSYSVHTSPGSLADGEAGIRTVRERSSTAGLMPR